jgi:hypothetical protein
MKIISLIIGFIMFITSNVVAQDNNKKQIIRITTVVSHNPVALTFTWPAIDKGTEVSVFRKSKSDLNWDLNSPQATLAGTATTYTDNTVVPGVDYEYFFRGYGSDYNPYTYIYGGVDVAQVDNRGKLILLVDDTFTTPLQAELSRLEMDLVGDGWQVIRHDVSRNALVTSIKEIIKTDYTADPQNVKSVFLFGHIPVPYTGSIAWDGHPNHSGAWPCDGYYADMTGLWTDNTVSTTQASRDENKNIIGDGKFDQSYFPAPTTLQIGRVDLANMTFFSPSELLLLKQYLKKDHDFRHKLIVAEPRAVIDNNFGLNGFDSSYFASCGWRSFTAMFEPSKITDGDYFTASTTGSYLWAYGAGGGSYIYAAGIGQTSDFADRAPKAVFNMLFGSYFGDWDSNGSFLRAPLASKGWGLASCWAGRPYWINHHTALGETIGYSAWITMRNTCYQSDGPNANQTSINLMGDPSLRIHPVAPAANLLVNGATLQWASSPETVTGYCIYRKNTTSGLYTKIATTANNITTFVDETAGNQNYNYMLRAQKLEVSNSGSYYNLSQGIFAGPNILPLNIGQHTVKLKGNTAINYWQTSNEINVKHINVQRSQDGIHFTTIQTVEAKGQGNYTYADTQLPTYTTTLYYRLQAVDNDEQTTYSNPVFVSLNIHTAAYFNVFPNPVTGKFFNIELNQLPQGAYLLTLVNTAGNVIKKTNFVYDGKVLTKKIDADIASGTYLINLQSDSYHNSKKIIIK